MPPSNVHIPILVFPVEDQENEMKSLYKEDEDDGESKYLEAVRKADMREQTKW